MAGTPTPDDETKRVSDSEAPTIAGKTQGAGGLDSTPSSLAPEDLSGERVLRGCTKIDFANGARPSIGRIALLARLGRGGMGVVYYGVNPRLGTEVAVKILPDSANESDPGLVDRFFREARIAAKLQSDHLVGVLDVDRDAESGNHFLVMEYVRGQSAGAWVRGLVRSGAVGAPESAALDVVIAATMGLAAAHFAGVVHRDVKPDNILIPADATGTLQFTLSKLADLGLARLEAGDQSLTGNQSALGTPGYMAPEQAKDAKRVKKPADVFGMGATLYALLAGRTPFAGSTAMETILKTLQEPHTPIRDLRPDVSDATVALIDICLARDPADRYPDAPALAEALQLCRAALWGGGAKDATVTMLQSIAQREEQGARVRTDASGQLTEDLPVPVATPAAAPLVTPVAAPASGGAIPRAEPAAVPAPRRPKWLIPAGVLVLIAAAVAYDVLRPSAPKTPESEGRAAPAPAPAAPDSGTAQRVHHSSSLSVVSRPAGAEVLIDGKNVGRTPMKAAKVPVGDHKVTLHLDEHADFEKETTFVADQTVDLGEAVLEPWPVLDLTSLGDGVSASLGRATIAGRVTVPPGATTVVLARDGCANQTLVLDAAIGKTVVVSPRPWEDFQARLDLSGLPADAKAMQDARSVSGIVTFAEGRDVTVDVTRPGFAPQHVVATLRLGTTTPLPLGPWAALSGTLDLSAFPNDAHVEIGGKAVAPGASLPPGAYTLHVTRDGYESRDVAVTVSAGEAAKPSLPAWVADAAMIVRLLTDLAAWDAATSGQHRAAAEWVAHRETDFALRSVESFSAGGRTHEVAIFQHARSGLEFVLVPSGKFAMGSADKSGRPDETLHTVTLTQPFLLARTECTQDAYERIAGANPSKYKGAKLPVEQVSWTEANAFCAKTGLALPTEAQWEWACRAGTTTKFATGDESKALQGFANVLDRFAQSHGNQIPYDSSKWTFSTEIDDGAATTAPVGSFQPNAFGLFDVHGNVWEWCADGYDAYPSGPVTDPAGGANRPSRVFRGGSWFHVADLARSAVRLRNLPDSRDDSLGFRPAKVVATR